MKIGRYLTIGIILLLTITNLAVLVQPIESNSKTERNSLALHEEMIEPDNIRDPREITEDLSVYKFSYNYEMEYDIPPKNVVLNIEGEMEEVDYKPEYMISIIRPDGVKFDRIIDQEMNGSRNPFEISLNLRGDQDVRNSIFEWAKKSGNPDELRPFQIDPVKLIFSKKNENILIDPEPLKGEYKFKVTMMGKNIDFEYGKKETCLFIMSEEPSEVRDLETVYDGEVNLDWKKPEDTGGSDIIQYNIYRATTMYNYVCIESVGPDQTEYVDDFDGETIFPQYKTGFDGDVLFYRVAAVNKDSRHYIRHIIDDWSLSKIPAQENRKSLSVQEVVHIPLLNKEKKSDKSYKWVMDYSKFTEDDFEKKLDRKGMDITGIKINELSGGDVFFYEVNHLEDEDGLKKYEYEGGFYSKGKADMEIRSTTSPSSFEINVDNSWIKFSGNIWAKEISTESYEGLSIIKQTISSQGKIKSSVNGTYDFEFYNEDIHWETSKTTDIEWDLDLTLDYEGNNSWVIDQKKSKPVPPASYEFNYSGLLNAQVEIEKNDNHGYSNESIQKSIDKELYGVDVLSVGHLYSEFTIKTFTPIIGASRVGYCLAFSQALDNLSYGQYNPDRGEFSPIKSPFRSNSQQYDYSMDKLYQNQCLDPMVVPGLGSLIGTEFKRAEGIHNKKKVEVLIKEEIRSEMSQLYPDVNKSAWREMREEQLKTEMWGNMLTGNGYILDQQTGPLGNEMVAGGVSYIEPIGYYGSRPIDDGDMKSFDDDKEKFFENQMYSKDEGNGGIPGFTSILLVISILMAILKIRKNQNDL